MMKNMNKKRICFALALVVLLTCGCVSNPGGVGETTEPTNLPTAAPTIGPTAGPTTGLAIEPSGTGEAGGTENTTAPATEPVTEPPTAPPTESPTEPPATEPPATEPPVTEPVHSHEYSSTVFAPSCTEDGYTAYTCECGDTYDDDYVEATGHDYETEVVEPTTTSEGYTVYTCIVCGYSFKDDYTEKLPEPTDPPCEHEYSRTSVDGTCLEGGHYLYECIYCGDSYTEPNGMGWAEHYYEVTEYVEATSEKDGYCLLTCRYCGDEIREIVYKESEPTEPPAPELDPYEVARAIAEAINELRANQGSTQLTWLPGMSQVAQYRSNQLVDNFAHDEFDIREAHAYYEYGNYIDMTIHGLPESANYYSSDSGEAILKNGSTFSSLEMAGEGLAQQILGSPEHWAYIGSSEYSYVGIGCTKYRGTWYVCILVGPINYG